MALKGVPAASRGNAAPFALACRRLTSLQDAGTRSLTKRGSRLSFRAVSLVAALAVGAMVTAACAPPNSPSGSGDGGVSVTPAAAGAGPIDVALTDTKGLDAPMALTPFASTAPAGDVTFNVKNLGTVDHEMIVLKTDTPFDQIPVVDSGDPPAPVTSGADKVDEANSVGETGDPNLKPGDARTFTIKGLAAGHYVLTCNIARHYGLGMRAPFTVK